MRALVLAVGVSVVGCAKPPAEEATTAPPPGGGADFELVGGVTSDPPGRIDPDPLGRNLTERYKDDEEPLLRALARGEVKPGDDLARLLERFPQYAVLTHDPYTFVGYADAEVYVAVCAKNGKVFRGSVIKGDHGGLFFDTMPLDEREHHLRSYEAAAQRRAAFRDVLPAAVGFAATLDLWWRPLRQ